MVMDPSIEEQMRHLPALAPPDGVKSNFDNPEMNGLSLGRFGLLFTYVLMLAFLALRLFARVCLMKQIHVDDYMALIAGGFITAFTVVSLSLFGHPLGVHQWDVRLSDFNVVFLSRTLSAVVLFAASALFVKLALLFLYVRAFAPAPTAKKLIWGGIVVITIYYVADIVINIIFCVPYSKTLPVLDPDEWAKKLGNSTCSQPVYNLNAATGVFGVISDLYILFIPVNTVTKLQMNRNRKLGILAIFLTGIAATIISIASVVIRFKQLHSYDFTWDSIPSYTLRAAELNLGLICTCLPVVVIVFKRIAHAMPWSSQKQMSKADPRPPSHEYMGGKQASGSDVRLQQALGSPSPVYLASLRSFVPGANSAYAEIPSLHSIESDDNRRTQTAV